MLVSRIRLLRCDKVLIHGLLWVLAVVHSESLVFVPNASNLKKKFYL